MSTLLSAHQVQVDEPALREGLPLKSERWDNYLGWAVNAFKLATTVAKPSTQIVTHLCLLGVCRHPGGTLPGLCIRLELPSKSSKQGQHVCSIAGKIQHIHQLRDRLHSSACLVEGASGACARQRARKACWPCMLLISLAVHQ